MRSKSLYAAFGLLFLFVTLFIHFFHTESAPKSSEACPACNYQHSTLATGQAAVIPICSLLPIGSMAAMDPASPVESSFIVPSSRSPPSC